MSQYYRPLEAEEVLYSLLARREEEQPTKLRVKRIHDRTLSEKRAASVARYAVRVITPEALDAVGLTQEAQKLRDLPPNVDLARARDIADDSYASRVAANVARADYDPNVDLNAFDYASAAIADAANAARYAAADAIVADTTYLGYAGGAAHSAGAAATSAAGAAVAANQPNRLIYHLEKMIELCLKIK